MSTSTWFLQSALASSQQVWMGPKLVATASSRKPRPSLSPSPSPFPPLSLVVEAKASTRRQDRTARHSRIRKKVFSSEGILFYICPSVVHVVEGTPERPRLCVFRSNKHLYVQVIDDTKMHTLASASTMQKPISEEFDYSSGPTISIVFKPIIVVMHNAPPALGSCPAIKHIFTTLKDVAKKVGEAIAKSCLEKGITKVAFDRGGYPYHGRVEALASAAREHGLQF
ncbi:50S ribosomal protein L18, chloroplastic [Morella rubra]|uniref:Large ribosomal subunit protein uL18c n=1 Tax=Morella rubra TaxID=262757 RepID=A0A6A1VLF9_9ROSI|nr:50S ribosomal protein L18, chloroplastic [Morella rubra]